MRGRGAVKIAHRSVWRHVNGVAGLVDNVHYRPGRAGPAQMHSFGLRVGGLLLRGFGIVRNLGFADPGIV